MYYYIYQIYSSAACILYSKNGEAVSVPVFLEVIYDYLDLWIPSNNDIFVVAVFVFRAIE